MVEKLCSFLLPFVADPPLTGMRPVPWQTATALVACVELGEDEVVARSRRKGMKNGVEVVARSRRKGMKNGVEVVARSRRKGMKNGLEVGKEVGGGF